MIWGSNGHYALAAPSHNPKRARQVVQLSSVDCAQKCHGLCIGQTRQELSLDYLMPNCSRQHIWFFQAYTSANLALRPCTAAWIAGLLHHCIIFQEILFDYAE